MHPQKKGGGWPWALLVLLGLLACGGEESPKKGEKSQSQVSASVPDQALASPGQDADYWLGKGRELGQLGDLHRAEGAARRALQLRPGDSEARDLLVGLWVAQGQFPRVIELLEKELAEGNDNAKIHFGLGKAYLQMDRPDRALQAFRATIDRDSSHVQAYNNLAGLYAQKSDVGEAIRLLEKARDLAPEYVHGHLNLGLAYAENGEYEKAIEAFQTTLKLDSLRIAAAYKLGELYCDLGREIEAVPFLQRALAGDSTSAFAHYQLGVAYLGLERKEEAIGEFEAATRLDPTLTEAFYQLGQVWLREGNRDRGKKALEVFQRWEEARKKDQGLWKRIDYFKKGMAVSPGNPLVHYQLGGLYGRQGWVAEAVHEYRRTLSANPLHAPALREMGKLLLQNGQMAEAIEVYEKMVGLWPQDWSSWNALCIAYTMVEWVEDAEKAFGRALRIHPNQPALYANLGTFLLKTERPVQALEAFRKALSLDPGNRDLERTVKRLSSR